MADKNEDEAFESEEDEEHESEYGYGILVHDSEEDKAPWCHSCSKRLSPEEDAGYTYCWTCIDKEGGNSVSQYSRPCLAVRIDRNGTVWEGMPDNPEPSFSWQEVPVYQEHPGRENYKRMTCTAMLEQIRLYNELNQFWHEGSQEPPPPAEIKYSCFVCRKEHVAYRDKKASD